MNILTFDIEEWYTEKIYFGDHSERYQKFDASLERILDCLDKLGIKATFFCVGGMAAEFPAIVKKIDNRGHEVGSHSFKHMWLNKMTEKEVLEDTQTSVDAIEQCIGKKIKSYRAPAFSIGEENKYVFEILSCCGFERDASVFPAKRNFGGFSQFGEKTPTRVVINSSQIKEFPVPTTKIIGIETAYSGGGYFRFFPFDYVRKEMSKSDYNMIYFHISDLIPLVSWSMNKEDFENYFKVPGTLKNRISRYVKSNLGVKGAFSKLQRLVETEKFVNLEQADAIINWEQAPSVFL